MPDVERILDKLAIDMSTTPSKKAYEQGFSNGKSYARKEILVILFIGVVGFFVIAFN